MKLVPWWAYSLFQCRIGQDRGDMHVLFCCVRVIVYHGRIIRACFGGRP